MCETLLSLPKELQTKFLTESDIFEVVAFQKKQSFTDGWNLEMLKSGFDSQNLKVLGLLKEENGEKSLVGFISFSLSFDTADVEDILVGSEFRGKGLGKFLLIKAEDEIRLLGKEKIFLEVRESNEIARNLYERRGFKQIGIRKKYYNGTENAVTMAKELL